MRTQLLLLAVAVLLAGCTAFPSGQAQERVSGVDVSATLTDDTVFADGGSTQLILEVTNNNPEELSDLVVEKGNVNNLRLERLACGLLEEDDDGTVSIDAAEFGVPVTEQCVWEVTPAEGFQPGPGQEDVRIPLTLFVSYTTRMTPREDSVKVSFESSEEISPGETTSRTVRAGNGDLSLTASHQGPVSADSGNVPLELEVSNTGTGDVRSLQGREVSEVEVSYEGSFMGIGGEGVQGLRPDVTTCLDKGSSGLKDTKTLTFLEGRSTASLECQFVLKDSALASASVTGNSFTLRPVVRYRYRVVKDAPLTLVVRENQ